MSCLKLTGILCAFGVLITSTAVASVEVGSIAPDFTLKDHKTGENVSLYDFEGEIVVLDFFAYWCSPCQTASSELEPYIQQYYDQLGGNPDGIPVTLLSLSLDNRVPSQVTAYQNVFGLDIVLEDTYVFWDFNATTSIPQFMVINGANSSNYDKWEVVYKRAGYNPGNYIYFLNPINSVKAATQVPGDANNDGKVDGSDVTILAGNWQQGVEGTPNATWAMGDFNEDGKVDGSDVTILAGNWQCGVTATATTVPEPSTIILITLGLGMLFLRGLTGRLSSCSNNGRRS